MAALGRRQFGLLVVGVLLAIGLNLIFCRWGVDLAGSSMLTFDLQDTPQATPGAAGAVGLYTAPWTVQVPLLAWLLGVVLPILVVVAAVAATWWPTTAKTRS